MKKIFAALLLMCAAAAVARADEPFAARFDGSMMPVDLNALPAVEVPDSLTPFFVNHIGRHGARFLTSRQKLDSPLKMLRRARLAGDLTRQGEDFVSLTEYVAHTTAGRWGQLDQLGVREEQRIAARLDSLFPGLLASGTVRAVSSPVNRAIASMYAFCLKLASLHPELNINAASGPRFNPLLRFFDTDKAYAAYIADGRWRAVYDSISASIIPTGPAVRLVGSRSGFTRAELQSLSMDVYETVRSLAAARLPADASTWMTAAEYEACWRASDLKHALQRTASPLSALPAEAARPLLREMVAVADSVCTDRLCLRGFFRFAHAETLMPLFSLMQLPGCHIPEHTALAGIPDVWADSSVVPLAANLQLIYFRGSKRRVYVLALLNGRPVMPLPGDGRLFVPWPELRRFWLSLIK